MCFVDLETAFDRVSRRIMQWALRKKGLPEILVKVVIKSMGVQRQRLKLDQNSQKAFYVVVGVYKGSVLSPLLFAIVVDVVTENARESIMKEILYTDDLVLMNKMMEGLKERFLKLVSALESKGLKMNLEKTKVIVFGLEGEIIQSRIDSCGICGKRVTVNSVLCKKCDQWIHKKCSKLKK